MKTSRFLRRYLSALLAAGAILTLGQGQALALTNAEIANLKGPDRQKILEEGAKKEGTVLWYVNLIEATPPLIEGFSKKYPAIKVQHVRDGATGLLQRIQAEYQAKNIKVDVYSASTNLSALKLPLHEPFYSPPMDAYPKEYRLPDGVGVVFRLGYRAMAYNTKMISKEQAPKDYTDLLQPQFKGKMSWGSSAGSGAPALISYWRKRWGEEKTEEFLAQLAKQDIKTVADAGRSVLDQVIAGEYGLTLAAATNHIAISIKDGAPVAAVLPPVVHSTSNTTSLVKGAPHPYAAMLFIDFLLSKDDGQQILKDITYVPAHPEIIPKEEERWAVPRLNGRQELLENADEFAAMLKHSKDLYDKYFKN